LFLFLGTPLIIYDCHHAFNQWFLVVQDANGNGKLKLWGAQNMCVDVRGRAPGNEAVIEIAECSDGRVFFFFFFFGGLGRTRS
jgi:hypothetical protein